MKSSLAPDPDPDPDGTGPLRTLLTEFRYDAMGRRTQVIHPDSNITYSKRPTMPKAKSGNPTVLSKTPWNSATITRVASPP